MAAIRVLVACGGGIATSTFAANEIDNIAKEMGIEIEITKHPLGDVPAVAKDFDVGFVTSKYKQDVGTLIVPVNGLITGIGEEETVEKIKEALTEVNTKING